MFFKGKYFVMSWKCINFALGNVKNRTNMNAKENIRPNVIVELRNGIRGVVVSFNGKPTHLIFHNYSNPITRYDDELKNKNSEYDIVKIYDGNGLETITDIWKKKYDISRHQLLWTRE